MYVTNSAHQGPSTLNAVGTVLLASATREGAIRLTRLGVVLPASLFLSSQSHSVSSRPRFSQLRPSRPLPPTQPPSSAPASPQPPGCPRSSRGAEARSIGRVVPRKCHLGRVTPAGFASVLPLGLQDEIRAKLRPGRRAAAHTAPVLAVLSLLSASLCYRLQPRRQVSPTWTRATWCCVTGLQVHPCCGT